MGPERVAREHHPGRGIVGEHGVGPVQVGGGDERQRVAAAQVHDVARLDGPLAEVSVRQGGQVVEGDLGGEDGRIGIHIQDVGHQARVVGLGVRDDNVVQGPPGRCQAGLQLRHVQAGLGGSGACGAWAAGTPPATQRCPRLTRHVCTRGIFRGTRPPGRSCPQI